MNQFLAQYFVTTTWSTDSLDGVIQHSADDGDFPYSDWTAPYRTPFSVTGEVDGNAVFRPVWPSSTRN